ncbi:hypothetical protein GF406_15220 [candidate division KSB1 bacterium]|nr:hypothetical protein [candidate division KSB1 bacterium]
MNKPVAPLQKHLAMIFIDGLGIGLQDQDYNPMAAGSWQFFNYYSPLKFPYRFSHNGRIEAVDANLTVSGLPQSATGQTTLLTGINAAQALGRHLSGFPNQRLRDIIRKYSVLKQLTEKRLTAAFLNTFRPPFFDFQPEHILRHLSATTLTNYYAGLPFFSIEDLKAERSIYQDMTGAMLIEKGFDVPVYSPEKAGDIVAHQVRNYHFVLYEYFQTDRAGHRQDMKLALSHLEKLDRFLARLVEGMDFADSLLLVISDHGNIEDLSVKMHTRNPAFCLICGKDEKKFKVESLTDIVPAILKFFDISN